ncbi:hypothetical protein yc1106_05179 [Curvularia clavata]|uniref:Uncharacterized protein n=1 Tax=Curvularia clavata TaxID=95742 RepID=A0A9Q9DTD7_CURCL|nr:hypothetical protein yc1106_05179 [Curvularia clavata]
MSEPFNPNQLSTQAIQTELQTAVASGTGGRAPKVYKRISAVLIHFEDDDIGCDGLEKELAETFRNFYNINNIKHLLIKNENAHLAVSRVLVELTDKGCTGKDCLVILVFSGHGKAEPEFDPNMIRGPIYKLKLGGAIGANGKFRTRTLDWNSATAILDDMECDVLHIMDCCFAAESMRSDAELLAAASQTAGSDANTSFTNAVIQELRRLSSRPFTISTLYQEIMRNRRALKLEYIPFYHRRPGRASVVLGGQRGPPVVPTLKPNDPRVLLAVHVSKTFDMQDLEDWKKWLSDLLPPTVMGMQIKLEGAWDSSSSVMLLSVPITVWAQLSNINRAFIFVGEVTSNNKCLEQATTTLAVRPLKGLENQKPGESSKKK